MYEVVKKAIKICFFLIPHYTKTRKHIGARKTWQITCLGARSLPHGRYIPTPGLSRSNLLINELRSPKLSVQSQLGGKTCRWFVFLVCIQRQTCAFLVLARLQRVFEDNFFLSLSWTEILPASQLVIIRNLINIYFSCLFFHFKN